MSGFTDRLENYRKSLGYTKRRFAEELGIKENNYNYFENGKRNPSKGFMIKLVTYSNKPEEYWLHGISEEEYVIVRNKFKCINTVVDQIVKMHLINDVDELFKENSINKHSIEELIIEAFKTDLAYEMKRNELKNKE